MKILCSRTKYDVVLAVVACGDRLHETLVMIKSAILFSSNVNLSVIVIADIALLKGFEEKVSKEKYSWLLVSIIYRTKINVL